MTKQKTLWACADCGHNQPKWTGQCQSCGNWNTFHEEVDFTKEKKKFEAQALTPAKPVRVNEVNLDAIDAPRSDVAGAICRVTFSVDFLDDEGIARVSAEYMDMWDCTVTSWDHSRTSLIGRFGNSESQNRSSSNSRSSRLTERGL